MQEKIADRIMAYWGYGKEFDPSRYEHIPGDKHQRKAYVEKKRRKFEAARHHAEALANIAVGAVNE